jgi:hypothetical protein
VARNKVARNLLAGPKPDACPICLTPAQDTGVRKLVWDHDHGNGHFRGWICCQCNRAIGLFADDPEALTRAALYLQLDKVRNPPKAWKVP